MRTIDPHGGHPGPGARATAFTLAACLLLAPAAARAAAAGGLTAASVETWTVDRGTTGALVEDHRAPLVEVRLVFPAGWWSPWAVRAGHVDEAFYMSHRDPGGSLRSRADRLALDLSLATDARTSILSIGCRRDDLDSALALARDILANRDLDLAELKRRNQGRRLEWAEQQKDPVARLKRAVAEMFYPPKDPRRPPARAISVPVESLPLLAAGDTLVRLPGRLVGFAGDLTRAEAERLAEGLLPPPFDSLPARAEPDLKPLVARDQRPDSLVVRLPRLTQVYFAMVRDGPPLTDADQPAVMVAGHVLAGNFHSRLYEALRHKGGDTYSVAALVQGEPVPGEHGAWTYTRVANAAAAESKMRDTLRAFCERGITEAERAAAVGNLIGRRVFGRQSPGQVLDRWLWERARGLDPGFRDRLAERAAALSLDEINAFIRRFYDPAAFSTVKVVPK